MIELNRTYTFEAAHCLPKVPPGHKCGRLHGHSYRLTVTITGPVGDNGMVMDFADIDAVARPLVDQLDHHTLNDIIDNPTSENLATYIWGALVNHLPLTAITVSETERSSATYRGIGAL